MSSRFRFALALAVSALAALLFWGLAFGAPPHWVRYARPSDHFDIEVPSNWHDIPLNPAAARARIAEAERRGDSGLATAYRTETSQPVSPTVRFRAFEYPPLATSTGLLTDVAVIRRVIPAGTKVSLSQVTNALVVTF